MNHPDPPRHLDGGSFAERAEGSCTLPASWYYEPEIWRREHKAIFYRSWWYLGHVSDVPDRGDFITGEVIHVNGGSNFN